MSNQQNLDCFDRISSLSDCLLLHILSFLIMEDAIHTSFLSRRWRYLWTSIRTIDFGYPCQHKFGNTDMVTYIDRSLFFHEGSNIHKFRLCFDYSATNSCQIDSWIRFAIRRDVTVLDIDFSNGYGMDCNIMEVEDGLIYKLPHCIFSCQSIQIIRLMYCDLNLPSSVSLTMLKTLTLSCMELGNGVIKHLTSGCPILENLFLIDCNRLSHFEIFSGNSCLKNLTIHNWYEKADSDNEIVIYAPDLVSIKFLGSLRRLECSVMNLSSLIKASFNFENRLYGGELYFATDENGVVLVRLLNDIRHAKDLKLCSWCVQVLSIREVQHLDSSSSFNATHLEVKTGLTKWELPGIAYLLRHCRSLETLAIFIDPKEGIKLDSYLLETYDFDQREYWNARDLSLSCMLQNLKTVKIHGFIGEGPNEVENEIELMKFLLKNSRALERMVIHLSKSTPYDQLLEMPKLRLELDKVLLIFPRASPNAEIHILYN